jgi:hypothetical protein
MDSGRGGFASNKQTGTAIRNELNSGGFHALHGRDGFLNSLDAVSAAQALKGELNRAGGGR